MENSTKKMDKFYPFILLAIVVIGILICIPGNWGKKYKLTDCSASIGVCIDDDGRYITTTNDDPQIIFDIDSKYIESIRINVTNADNEPWKCQVFYSEESGSFSEENSVVYYAEGDEKAFSIKINSEVSYIRIDLGEKAEAEYIFRDMKLNLKSAVNFKQLIDGTEAEHKISMTFTTINFLFVFLPLCVCIYYLLHKSVRKYLLVAASLIFYTLSEPILVWLLIISVIVNYYFGLLLAKNWKRKIVSVMFLVLSLIWNFGILFYYKYAGFSINVIEAITGKSIDFYDVIQPLGISFFVFRTVSYCVDMYWKVAMPQRNIFDVALYVTFFPQISMGPISRYNDFNEQLVDKKFDIDLFIAGIKRIIIGLSKKLIIANNIGGVVDGIFSLTEGQRTVSLAWLGIIGYLIQLYYDFSGYSDIAIGIGNLFGFRLPENFNYPFVSKNVVEYWSRWHITLGTWLKVYIYTPVIMMFQGGRLPMSVCNIFALFCVWLFAGVWHGAGWNYLCYGMYYFVFIVIERLIEDIQKKRRKKLKQKKKPETVRQRILSHIYFFCVLIVGQLIFRSTDMVSFINYIKSMFAIGGNSLWSSLSKYYFLKSIYLVIIGTFFAFPLVKIIKKRMDASKVGSWIMALTGPVVYGLLLVVSIAFAMTDSYQAFIYFQF